MMRTCDEQEVPETQLFIKL